MQRANLATAISANGNVAAWQEAIVGAESNGMRLAEVRVNVGDVVRRGAASGVPTPVNRIVRDILTLHAQGRPAKVA